MDKMDEYMTSKHDHWFIFPRIEAVIQLTPGLTPVTDEEEEVEGDYARIGS